MHTGKVFLLVLALSVTQAVSGTEVYRRGIISKKNSYQTNRFFENIFIGASGGVNLYMGREDNSLGIGKRLAPALDVYVGKWFTPWIGGRLMYSGLSAKGWSSAPPFMEEGSMTDGFYREEFNTMYFHADFMWNISHTIGGYRPERFWNFIPYLGAGYIRLQHKCGCHYGDDIAASVGLYNTLRISRVVDITLDVRQTILGSKAIDPEGDAKFDYMATASLGIAFKIGNKRFARSSNGNTAYYTNQIKDFKKVYKKINDRADALSAELEAEKTRMVRIIDSVSAAVQVKPTIIEREIVKKSPAVPIALFFEVGKADLGAKEIVNLNFYVENAIKADPGRVFTLTGIVDNSSGNKASNKALAEKRVQYVYNLLVDEYGISPKRLVNKGVTGGDNFPDSRLNRVVIIK